MEKKFIDKLAYIHVQDKKLLVTLSKGKDTWYIPGGKREEGETDEEALTREVYEELSVPLKQDTIDFYGVFEAPAHGKPLGTMVRMTCYTAAFEGELIPAAEIAELDFFEYSQKDETSAVDHLIFDDLYEKGWIE
ncbi:MAG: NUDIX domain-containing protein [Pseudomonadales bacterium]|nr:NUDIX domain-containing protein [Pseudomonadales bacterium]